MPEGISTYLVEGTPVDVDEKDTSAFLENYPDALEAASFVVDGDTVDVETKDVDQFLAAFPTATPTFEEPPPTEAQQIFDTFFKVEPTEPPPVEKPIVPEEPKQDTVVVNDKGEAIDFRLPTPEEEEGGNDRFLREGTH